MARTRHGHHIPGTELDEEPYTPASICGGSYGCGQCIEEVRKAPKHGGVVVPIIDRVSLTPHRVGWAEVDEKTGKVIGEMVFTDADFVNDFLNPIEVFSITETES